MTGKDNGRRALGSARRPSRAASIANDTLAPVAAGASARDAAWRIGAVSGASAAARTNPTHSRAAAAVIRTIRQAARAGEAFSLTAVAIG